MTDLQEKTKGGAPISKQAAYSKAAAYFDLALDTLIDILKNGRQESVRLSAANKLIDKVLPDLKSQDIDLKGKLDGRIIAVFQQKPTE